MDLKKVGLVASALLIGVMVFITIKTSILNQNDSFDLEDYPSGMIEDQTDREIDSELDISKVGLKKGSLAPNFQLKDMSGESKELIDYKGKIVFLNFWATWCPPCRIEMPHMENYYEKYKEIDNVEILAVNMTSEERKSGSIEEFVKTNELTFPVLLDEYGEVKRLYKVLAYPTTYIINEDGIIVDSFSYSIDEEQIRKIISQAKNDSD